MSELEYLQSVLKSQTFEDGCEELKQLRHKRDEIEKIIRKAFPGADLAFKYGGSKAKGTMIKESYDLDLVCYFAHDETAAGNSLEEIYNRVKETLEPDYTVVPRRSSLKLEDPDDDSYTHIDVVPGRFVDDTKNDVFLHQNEGEKSRLKTNLGVHIEHIGQSGLTPTIKLIKLWRERKLLKFKTFVLELLVVKILSDHKEEELDTQLRLFFEELRDNIDNISIEDPANSNNDLSPIYNDKKADLQRYAEATLQEVDAGGWKAVFGDVDDEVAEGEKAKVVASIPYIKTSGSKPWTSSE